MEWALRLWQEPTIVARPKEENEVENLEQQFKVVDLEVNAEASDLLGTMSMK
jgi:hypothetical protein